MATLSDVAREAGVSKATASRAMNRPDLVAPETISRVLAAAHALKFVPNLTARNLALGRTGVIAMLIPTPGNAFFTPIISGAQARAEELGLFLTVTTQPLGGTGELIRLQKLARQVDGFIVVAPRGPDPVISEAMALRPSVLVDRELVGHTSVIADTSSAFATLLSYLAECGHHHVVYAGGPDQSWQNTQRTRAIQTRARSLGMELTVLGPTDPSFLAGQALSIDVFNSGATAVLPYAMDLGLGILFALARAGHTDLLPRSPRPAPGKIHVIGVPHTPAVAVDGVTLGREALEQLCARLDDAPPTQVRLPVPLSGVEN